VLAVLRSRWARRAFVFVALAGALYAVVADWDQIRASLHGLPAVDVLAAFVVNVVYLFCTMASWRAILTDLGSRLPFRAASELFFVSQLGKYVPGGVWHLVAASELGVDRGIPRRRSVSAVAVSVLVGLAAGLVAAVPMVVLRSVPGRGWMWLALPVALALLAPPVLNRVLALAMRVLRLEPLEHPLTTRGIASASAWALVGWVVVGLAVWLLALGLGLERSGSSLLLVIGAYAVAWIAGFAVVVAPAGLGVRELVLGALLAGVLPAGSAVALVLVARVLQTVADVALAGAGYASSRRAAARTAAESGAEPADRHDAGPAVGASPLPRHEGGGR
jgi:uncharacterized membrane protein YbhN (UPF0104 family)